MNSFGWTLPTDSGSVSVEGYSTRQAALEAVVRMAIKAGTRPALTWWQRLTDGVIWSDECLEEYRRQTAENAE